MLVLLNQICLNLICSLINASRTIKMYIYARAQYHINCNTKRATHFIIIIVTVIIITITITITITINNKRLVFMKHSIQF